ncbi:MAG: glycosyltransferase [Flavobacteriaceae bacterium]|nr:hypothetical protein [Flavobacteriaceae bacterium]
MNHFLITRFNIKSENWKFTKSGALTHTDLWLEQRFNLFETYCLPSVKNQSNQEFKWFVIFDLSTPNAFKNRIETLASSYSNLIVLYTESFQTLKATLYEAIITNLTPKHNFIITTRLDNDDAIHTDFINCIQLAFKPQHNTIVDVIKGYQYIVNSNDVRYYTSNYNPFISLIEDTSMFETVMAKNHEHWKTLPNRIVYNKKALWLQVVHEDNILNSKINSLKKTYQIDFSAFGLQNLSLKVNKLKTLFFNIRMAPLRAFEKIKNVIRRFIKYELKR